MTWYLLILMQGNHQSLLHSSQLRFGSIPSERIAGEVTLLLKVLLADGHSSKLCWRGD